MFGSEQARSNIIQKMLNWTALKSIGAMKWIKNLLIFVFEAQNMPCTNFPISNPLCYNYKHCCLFFPHTNCFFLKKLEKKYFFFGFSPPFFSNVLMIARHEVWRDTLTVEKVVCIKFYNDQEKYSTECFNNHLMWCVYSVTMLVELTVVVSPTTVSVPWYQYKELNSLLIKELLH